MTKSLVIDLDGTLTVEGSAERYEDVLPRHDMIAAVKEYAKRGFRIIVVTSRNMRSFENSIGRINAITLPVAIEWLKRHEVPFDEIHVGRPWCGDEGFYVDDRTVRPSEFKALGADKIMELLKRERSR